MFRLQPQISLFFFLYLSSQASASSSLIQKIGTTHQLSQKARQDLQKIFDSSHVIGQGSKASKHPISRQQCSQKTKGKHIAAHPSCGKPYMVKLPESSTCIDQFEFPNIPCEYPVTWVKPIEAHQICQAMGKRLCDAHEWEAGCSGSAPKANYPFEAIQHMSPKDAVRWMRQHHNKQRQRVWGYGHKENQKACSTSSKKSPGCDKALATGQGVYQQCGSNTFPAGHSLECKSSIGVYDIHGNAAEHMNLPLRTQQLGQKGGIGVTEMKGSWFIFQSVKAHADDCHWRAPFWHGSQISHPKGHANYHLGFRCCLDL